MIGTRSSVMTRQQAIVALLLLAQIAPRVAAQWQTATLSVNRSWLVGLAVGQTAFFAGGKTQTYAALAHTADLTPPESASNAVDFFNGTWSTATLSVARYEIAAARAGTKALFAAGLTSYAFALL
jgi:hypothetical protein